VTGAPPTDEQLAALLLRTLAAVVALLLAVGGTVAVGKVADRDEHAEDALVGDPGGSQTAPSAVLTEPGTIGPLPGSATTPYAATRAAALAAATGPHVAVVSFSAYRPVADVPRVLAPGGAPAVRLFVALPGGRPVEIAGNTVDVAALAARQRSEAADEKRALEKLLPTVEDADFAAQYRADLDRLTAVLAARRPAADAVFGALVVADAAALRTLASAPGVRLVDLGPGSDPPPLGRALALRPEEPARAGVPPTRPIG
jgi:hypothetical protein